MANIDKIRKFLREADYSLEYSWINKSTWADIDYEEKTIRINLPLLVVNYFVHEFLHDQDKEASEKTIEERTERVIKRMTVKEIKEIHKKIDKNAEIKI